MPPKRLTETRLPPKAGLAERPAIDARLPQFIALIVDPREVLPSLSIALVGTGGVGGPMALHLARLQVGTLILIDPGRFKLESLQTQLILPEHVGKTKVSVLGQMCKKISPKTKVLAFAGAAQALPATVYSKVDLVLLATDNLLVEVVMGQLCLNLAKPFLQASVNGETLVAQVRCFPNQDGDCPCPACGFGKAEWDALNHQVTYSCEGLAAGKPMARLEETPTRSVSPLCSLAADFGLMIVLRHALRLGKPLEPSLLHYCGYNHQTFVTRLKRNPECLCDHQVWHPVQSPRPALGECSLNELLAAAGVLQDPSVSLLVDDDLSFAEAAACVCGHHKPLQRFVSPAQPAGRCPRCAQKLYAVPFLSHRPVPMDLLAPHKDSPLKTLGAAKAKWLVVRAQNQAAFFECPANGKEAL